MPLPFFSCVSCKRKNKSISPSTPSPQPPPYATPSSSLPASFNSAQQKPNQIPNRKPTLRQFSLVELQKATSNFSTDNLIEQGSFGNVYVGRLSEPNSKPNSNRSLETNPSNFSKVSVKKFFPNKISCLGFRWQDQWLVEIFTLQKLCHPNLIQLVGYYGDEKEAILVYDYLPNFNLCHHLFPSSVVTGAQESSVLTWRIRFQIIFQIASAISYLHQEGIIHRGLKASNILLDMDFNAYLSDFGLAKEGPLDGETHVSTTILGSLGYIDPKYGETGHLTKGSDVYSFGIIMLEILTGKRAVGVNAMGRPMALVSWVVPALCMDYNRINDFLDPALPEAFPKPVAKLLAKLARHCLNNDPVDRPAMATVVETLSPLYSKYSFNC